MNRPCLLFLASLTIFGSIVGYGLHWAAKADSERTKRLNIKDYGWQVAEKSYRIRNPIFGQAQGLYVIEVKNCLVADCSLANLATRHIILPRDVWDQIHTGDPWPPPKEVWDATWP